jgi:hypothetical protein
MSGTELSEINTGIDLSRVRDMMQSQEFESGYGYGENDSRRVFLGTVMSLSPSGKYYTAWANSNVTESEIDTDETWYNALESQLSDMGYSLESGEGSSTDLFAVEYKD